MRFLLSIRLLKLGTTAFGIPDMVFKQSRIKKKKKKINRAE